MQETTWLLLLCRQLPPDDPLRREMEPLLLKELAERARRINRPS